MRVAAAAGNRINGFWKQKLYFLDDWGTDRTTVQTPNGANIKASDPTEGDKTKPPAFYDDKSENVEIEKHGVSRLIATHLHTICI